MKKPKLIAALLLIGLTFYIGFRIGVRHAGMDSEIWLNEYVVPEEGDWLIHVTIDGRTYDQSLWIY